MSALLPKPDIRTPPEHRRADNQRTRNESAIVSLSHGPAGVTKSIRSIYADYGTQWQEVAIPPQHGRIKAGRATAVIGIGAPTLVPTVSTKNGATQRTTQ